VKARHSVGALARWAAGVALAASLASCSHGVLSQADAASEIDAGSALNTHAGSYHAHGVDVTLVKVVSLPDEMLGLRFSFDSDLPQCCSVFPRIALSQGPDTDAHSSTEDIVVPVADIEDGKLTMRLSDGASPTSPFTVDLAALEVGANA
jgi:hypothetical protein